MTEEGQDLTVDTSSETNKQQVVNLSQNYMGTQQYIVNIVRTT